MTEQLSPDERIERLERAVGQLGWLAFQQHGAVREQVREEFWAEREALEQLSIAEDQRRSTK